MERQMDSQTVYEKQLVYHLVIFLKAMQQYSNWGRRAVASDVLRSDPQFETGMRQLFQAISLCGQHFQGLPEPPGDGLEADLVIRSMGQEADQFCACLEKLLRTEDPVIRDELIAALAVKSRQIQKGYRGFAELYEQVFPGRLSQALQSLQVTDLLDAKA